MTRDASVNSLPMEFTIGQRARNYECLDRLWDAHDNPLDPVCEDDPQIARAYDQLWRWYFDGVITHDELSTALDTLSK